MCLASKCACDVAATVPIHNKNIVNKLYFTNCSDEIHNMSSEVGFTMIDMLAES